jgi:hypothetical protein
MAGSRPSSAVPTQTELLSGLLEFVAPCRGFLEYRGVLASYFESELLDGSKLWTKADAIKEIAVRENPRVLTLHLEWFAFAGGAMEKTKSELASSDTLRCSRQPYDLAAVISHFGQAHTRHYHVSKPEIPDHTRFAAIHQKFSAKPSHGSPELLSNC